MMTTKRIVYTRPDGGVSVVVPAPRARLPAETDDEFIARIRTKDVPPDASDVQIIEESTVLSDRTFRNAWRQTAGIISVDMPLARTIHAERIATGQASEIARLKIEERKERLLGNPILADQHAADLIALNALSLSVLAAQIQAAPNPTALSTVGPTKVPK